jgi:twitching motility protein PilT
VPFNIMPLEELGLPKTVSDMCERPRGLVLVTGPTGSGKSTTLASMLDRINTRHRSHIITIEDPIEFLHPHKNCLVNQREVGADTQSFGKALRHILRQDPDVVLIGEMRDLETIDAAMSIAETGHLCLATLHTTSAIGSINRIIDVFPAHQQPQIRQVLSFVLEGIISQTLIPRASGTGQVLAAEVLIPTPAIRNLIREDKLHQVYSQMQIGQSKHGMLTLNQSLCDLFLRRLITLEDAMARSPDHDELKNLIAGGGQLGSGGANPGVRRAEEVP